MQWQKPFLTAFSDQDPFTRGADAVLRSLFWAPATRPTGLWPEAATSCRKMSGEELGRFGAIIAEN